MSVCGVADVTEEASQPGEVGGGEQHDELHAPRRAFGEQSDL